MTGYALFRSNTQLPRLPGRGVLRVKQSDHGAVSALTRPSRRCNLWTSPAARLPQRDGPGVTCVVGG